MRLPGLHSETVSHINVSQTSKSRESLSPPFTHAKKCFHRTIAEERKRTDSMRREGRERMEGEKEEFQTNKSL